MKHTFLLLLPLVICSGNCIGQPLIDLDYREASMLKVLSHIADSGTAYDVIFEPSHLKKCRPVTISAKGISQLEALRLVTPGQPITVIESGGMLNVVPRDIEGYVYDKAGHPIEGATIDLKNGSSAVQTDSQGKFVIRQAAHYDYFIVSHVNKYIERIAIKPPYQDTIVLTDRIIEISPVTVARNGYEALPPERVTGNIQVIEQRKLEKRPTPTVPAKIDNLSAGLYVQQTPDGQLQFYLRGIGTFYASSAPLIVVDNFPFEGNLNNLNPADIATITVLKDAAATSIWGARAGNGVIVITTKDGSKQAGTAVTITTALSISPKPDPWQQRRLGAADYIAAEESFFNNPAFNFYKQDYVFRSPVAEVLEGMQNGRIDGITGRASLQQWGQQDVRQDIRKYLYKHPTWQQIHAGIQHQQQYFSVGYDRMQSGFTGGTQERFTLTTNLRFPLSKRLTLYPMISLVKNRSKNDKAPWQGYYPYLRLADENGGALPVPRDLAQGYKDTLPFGKLLDWNYRPLDDLQHRDYRVDNTQVQTALALAYELKKGLSLWLRYQFFMDEVNAADILSLPSYDFRHLINSYSSRQAGVLTSPIPAGPIKDWQFRQYRAEFLRLQGKYEETFGDFQFNAFGGAEYWWTHADTSGGRIYAYNSGMPQLLNYNQDYPLYFDTSMRAKIPFYDQRISWKNYYYSYFANAGISYDNRYYLTLSGRLDQSNLLGAHINQATIPLWSAGGKWELMREDFFRVSWITYLSLRASIGYSGNIDKSATSPLTFSRGYVNRYGSMAGIVQNAPNPDLSWEKSRMINVGLNFELSKSRLSGSIDYYWRRANNLMDYFAMDATTGITLQKRNAGALNGKGFEVSLKSTWDLRPVQWDILTLFSYSTQVVKKTGSSGTTAFDYVNPNTRFLREGYPVDALFSFAWAGLSPDSGDPMGYLKGTKSNQYDELMQASPSTLVYHGPTLPRYFGSMQHSFTYRQLELSVMVTGKFGYYFRRPSINYTKLWEGSHWGDPDYNKRWLKPGDEVHTQVPSFPQAPNLLRDQFYANSSVLAEPGDHIRLREVRLGWTASGNREHSRLKELTVYAYVSNPCLLYIANDAGIDPDAVNFIPTPMSITLGAQLKF